MVVSKSNLINLTIFIISFIAINSQDYRVLNFYHKDGKIYSFEEKKDNFKILTKEKVDCFVEPCILPVLAEQTLENEEDFQSLKSLFNELFTDPEVKEKRFIEQELSDEQAKIILNLLKKYKIFITLEYEIINDSDQHNGIFKKRGYLYKTEDESVICTIAMGQKPSGGIQ